ncbi:MAG: YggS family pyridoxal phosphate-dependent enzyme [Chitinivibrionales bacterium]|nr:YggS family pyridoxal phosphate-dependent enzyme [Chitinivibrionales bacterium]
MSNQMNENYDHLQTRIAAACKRVDRSPDSVRLIVVTKTHPVETVQSVIDLGITDIGENRVQEIVHKEPHLTGEYTLHMVGHLQTNKVNKVLPHIRWIHSIDREKLVNAIESAQKESSETINALVQVNTSGESSKYGCSPDKCLGLCERVCASGALQFRGLMTIGPLGGGEAGARKSFEMLRNLGEKCRGLTNSLELSMGMSDDFEWAIEEGATMIRVGSLLLGRRSQ